VTITAVTKAIAVVDNEKRILYNYIIMHSLFI